MSVSIRLKHSATKDKAPLPTDLGDGELALNTNAASPAAYIKDSAGAVVKLAGVGGVATPNASKTVRGIAELATQDETTAGTDDERIVTPKKLKFELDKNVQKSGDTMTGNLTVPSMNTGQLAGFRNVLINGNLAINQRGVDIASAATGSYGQDRWKRTAGGMTQIIEEGNFDPGATYTLSGTGITTQQLTAPASGNWTLPDIPVTARKIQLEPGPVATPFEHRPISIELALCQRYCYKSNISFNGSVYVALIIGLTDAYCFHVCFPVTMRTYPTEVRASLWKIGMSAGSGTQDINAIRLIYPTEAWYGVPGGIGTGERMLSLRPGEPSPVYDAEL